MEMATLDGWNELPAPKEAPDAILCAGCGDEISEMAQRVNDGLCWRCYDEELHAD